jgi:sodium transport system ATP-binding protein
MIEVEHLTKVFDDPKRGEVAAVQDLSFRVGQGEIVGLLGPNGAGKTTALRMLCTVLKPTAGTARVAGFDVVREASEVRRRIGFLSANTGIYDRMTAWEFVEYFGRLYGLGDAELHQAMETLFRRLDMESFRDVLGARLSSGMKQKVSIARTLIHDPPVLVFDELTVGLDVLVAREVLDTIRELRDRGKAIVFSTHIMREAQRLCDRVVILHRGRTLAQGSLAELSQRYAEPDLEDLFVRLLRQAEADSAAPGEARPER